MAHRFKGLEEIIRDDPYSDYAHAAV